MARNQGNQWNPNSSSQSTSQSPSHSFSPSSIDTENSYSRQATRANSGQYSSQSSRDSWNGQDDTVMRRGDDRTRDSMDYGYQGQQDNHQANHQGNHQANHQGGRTHFSQNNSYRTDDYPTDTPNYRGSANSSTMGSGSGMGSGSSYGWSNDYRQGGDYRAAQDRGYNSSLGSNQVGSTQGWNQTNGLNSSQGSTQGWNSNQGSNFGDSSYAQNHYGSSMSYGAGMGTGSSTSSGPHTGKGPKNYKRSDDRIREDVSDALERHPQIDASEIEVDVKDGVVTLRGHVEERRLKRVVEDSIEHLQGVRDVRNELQADQTLFQQAKSALFGDSTDAQSSSSSSTNRTAPKSKH